MADEIATEAVAESESAGESVLKVAIVVPTYNEAESLPTLISKVVDQNIEGLGFVIVDDGSPDGTGEIADKLARCRG